MTSCTHLRFQEEMEERARLREQKRQQAVLQEAMRLSAAEAERQAAVEAQARLALAQLEEDSEEEVPGGGANGGDATAHGGGANGGVGGQQQQQRANRGVARMFHMSCCVDWSVAVGCRVFPGMCAACSQELCSRRAQECCMSTIF